MEKIIPVYTNNSTGLTAYALAPERPREPTHKSLTILAREKPSETAFHLLHTLQEIEALTACDWTRREIRKAIDAMRNGKTADA